MHIRFVICSDLTILNDVCRLSSVYQTPRFAGGFICYNSHITILHLLFNIPQMSIGGLVGSSQIGVILKFVFLKYVSIKFLQPIFYAHYFPCAFTKTVISNLLKLIWLPHSQARGIHFTAGYCISFLHAVIWIYRDYVIFFSL